MTRKFKNEKRDIILIIISGILIHLTMLFVSGAWWDDWKFYVNDYFDVAMRTHYISAGRLDAYYIIGLVNQLPVCLFRLVVIICFTLSAVFIYKMLLNLFNDRHQAFIISILYNAIPVNDVRLMKCVFPYTFALCFFWLGTLLLTYTFKTQKKRNKYILRIFTLILYFVAFSTSSLLVYYIIPLAIIWFIEAYELIKEKNLHFRTYLKRVLKYLDFYILPILFWSVKNIFFSASGLYKSYNSVSVGRSLSAITLTGKTAVYSGAHILFSWFSVIKENLFIIVCFAVIVFACFLLRDSFAKEMKHIPKRYQLLGIIIGGVIYLLGLFPYVVVRQGVLSTTGLEGRDSLLACLGICIMVYYFMNLLSIPNWGQYALAICIMFASFLHFHGWYMTYLKDYYDQVALQQNWRNTNEVKDGKTFIYIRENNSRLNADRFYSLCALSKQVYGDTSRFFSCGINDLKYITDSTNQVLYLYVEDTTSSMDQYDMSNIKIDGIMIADYNLTIEDCYKLKFEELFRHDDFLNDVEGYIEYSYIPIDAETSEQILKMYEDGILTSNDELIEICSLH